MSAFVGGYIFVVLPAIAEGLMQSHSTLCVRTCHADGVDWNLESVFKHLASMSSISPLLFSVQQSTRARCTLLLKYFAL